MLSLDASPPLPPGAVVAVVGGGVSGLAAAHRLRSRRPDLRVVVLEGSPQVGGKLRLDEVGGVRLDVGAESMLFRRPEGVDLAQAVGLGGDVVHPAAYAARVWTRGALRPLPRSVMGVPADLAALADSGLLSADGLERAAREPDLPARPLADGEDVSVGDLVEHRYGPEVVDRLVEPLLGGVYAGQARRLSARATVPQVVALLDRGPSLTRAAADSLAGPRSDAPVFAGVRGGLGRLPAALVADADLDVRTGVVVRGLLRTPAGFALETGPAVAPARVDADAVVLAVPALPAGRLLAEVVPSAAHDLGSVQSASTAVVTLAYPASALVGVQGSGFLVPPVDGRLVKAATFSFRKWDWVREGGVGADGPDDVVVLRCSVGRLGEEHLLQRTDEELVAASVRDLEVAVGTGGSTLVRPLDGRVTRWGGALPQYAVGHLDLVARVRASVARVPRLAVCGATYDGVGVPACIASAHRAVDELLA